MKTLYDYISTSLYKNVDKEHINSFKKNIINLSEKASVLYKYCQKGAISENFGGSSSYQNADGDVQKTLDVYADELFLQYAYENSISHYASEEQDDIITLDKDKPFALAIDPLDGSSNITNNIAVGTIFSFFKNDHSSHKFKAFAQKGTKQVAAGYFIYSTQLSLIFTAGHGVAYFIYDQEKQAFILIDDQLMIKDHTCLYATNHANFRFWMDHMQRYIVDCQEGENGVRKKNFNTRWTASLVADSFRVLQEGGIFLYPEDKRKGYEKGRLRLLYEAFAVSFIIEQAGGISTDGQKDILEYEITELHQRVPLIFGSKDEITIFKKYSA